MPLLVCIPGTIIEDRYTPICRAPAGKFRVIIVDTIAGDFSVTQGGDFDDLAEAQTEAAKQTGPLMVELSGQTSNKVYVFNDSAEAQSEHGGI